MSKRTVAIAIALVIGGLVGPVIFNTTVSASNSQNQGAGACVRERMKDKPDWVPAEEYAEHVRRECGIGR